MRKIIGWCLLVFGVIGLASETEDLIAGESEVIFGFVMAGLFIAGGVGLLRSAARAKRARLEGRDGANARKLEPRLFKLAGSQGGRITAVEASAALGQPFDVCREILDDLSTRGACQVLVTEEGATVYRFPELEAANGKRDLLES